MREFPDSYSFTTFQDGEIVFHKKNYKKHSAYHPEIQGPAGLSEIQDALIYPDFITSYVQKNAGGKVISHNKSYYRILKRFQKGGKRFIDYWVVRLVRIAENPDKWCITTSFMNTAPFYAMISSRIQTVIYKKQ